MGNNENMSSKKEDEKNKLKNKIKEYINKSYYQKFTIKKYIYECDIYNWKNLILEKIFEEIDNQAEIFNNNIKVESKSNNKQSYSIVNTHKINYYPTKKKYKIESIQNFSISAFKNLIKIENIQNLNFYTSKDIQDENKEITRIFQKEAYNYMNDDEKNENENVAFFLRDVAEISRNSYYEANKLFKVLFEKFNLSIGKKPNNDDQNKKEFSSWIKEYEKNNKYPECDQMRKYEGNKAEKYLSDLFYQLRKMYLHCHLSIPIVEINFEKEEIFNSEKMIDFINRGHNRRVNFVILPSLISNKNFLQNGKSWVFTYIKNTFKFQESELILLNNNSKRDSNQLSNSLKNISLEINKIKKDNAYYVVATTNFEISNDIEKKYCFHLRDKNNNIKRQYTKDNYLRIPANYKVHKCILIIGDKSIDSNILNQ